jgi:spore coat protein U-like protein
MRKQILAPLAAGVLLALAGAAQAATKTASFTVSASVGKNCVISAGNLALGEFIGDNDLEAESTITVRCTDGTDFDIALNAGVTGNYGGRRMEGPGDDYLVYNLYTDDTYAAVWGDTTGDTEVVSGEGEGMAAGNAVTRTVYGRLLASDNLGPVEEGAYSDTIVATITY